jgi:hypothetical protein
MPTKFRTVTVNIPSKKKYARLVRTKKKITNQIKNCNGDEIRRFLVQKGVVENTTKAPKNLLQDIAIHLF